MSSKTYASVSDTDEPKRRHSFDPYGLYGNKNRAHTWPGDQGAGTHYRAWNPNNSPPPQRSPTQGHPHTPPHPQTPQGYHQPQRYYRRSTHGTPPLPRSEDSRSLTVTIAGLCTTSTSSPQTSPHPPSLTPQPNNPAGPLPSNLPSTASPSTTSVASYGLYFGPGSLFNTRAVVQKEPFVPRTKFSAELAALEMALVRVRGIVNALNYRLERKAVIVCESEILVKAMTQGIIRLGRKSSTSRFNGIRDRRKSSAGSPPSAAEEQESCPLSDGPECLAYYYSKLSELFARVEEIQGEGEGDAGEVAELSPEDRPIKIQFVHVGPKMFTGAKELAKAAVEDAKVMKAGGRRKTYLEVVIREGGVGQI